MQFLNRRVERLKQGVKSDIAFYQSLEAHQKRGLQVLVSSLMVGGSAVIFNVGGALGWSLWGAALAVFIAGTCLLFGAHHKLGWKPKTPTVKPS